MQKIKLLLVSVVLSLHAAFSHAQTVPAQFGLNKDEFISRFTLPALDEGEELLLRCGADVDRSGLMLIRRALSLCAPLLLW